MKKIRIKAIIGDYKKKKMNFDSKSYDYSRLDTLKFSDINVVDAIWLMKKYENENDFIILDVRTSQEFESGSIDNALHIDYFAEDFNETLLMLDKEKTYLVYCRSGFRSKKTMDIMKKNGFGRTYNMKGGFLAWRNEISKNYYKYK